MPLASTSAVQVTYVREATFGVTPLTGATKSLRVTGESLDFAITKEASKEINASRTISSMVPTNASVSGGVQGELSYQEWDDLMASTLQSSFAAFGVGTTGVSVPFTTTAGGITATSITASIATTGTSAFTNLQRGQWFRLVAPGDASNNGRILRVSTLVAPTATVLTVDANTPLVANAGTVTNATVSSTRLTHGSTQTSFSIERAVPDATVPQFFNYRGATPSKFNVKEASGALTSVGFDFMGQALTRSNGATQLPGPAATSYAYEIHSGVAGAAVVVFEGGAPLLGTFVKSIDLSFDNTLRMQDGIGTLGCVGIGSGTISVTGQMEIYLVDGLLYDKFLNNSVSSLVFSSIDAAGNGYVFTLPRIVYSGLKTNASGKDQDLMLSLSFTGLRDTTNAVPALQRAMFIDRVGQALA